MTVYVSIAGDCIEHGKISLVHQQEYAYVMTVDYYSIQWNTTEKMKINMGEFQKCYCWVQRANCKADVTDYFLKAQQQTKLNFLDIQTYMVKELVFKTRWY